MCMSLIPVMQQYGIVLKTRYCSPLILTDWYDCKPKNRLVMTENELKPFVAKRALTLVGKKADIIPMKCTLAAILKIRGVSNYDPRPHKDTVLQKQYLKHIQRELQV